MSSVDLKKLGEAIVKSRNRAEISALKTVEGLMKVRIHNRGQSTEAGLIGRYRSRWRQVRLNAGLQVAYKDLEFTGDLKRNVTVGVSDGENVLGFRNTKARLIAQGQEQQTKKEIYTPTEREYKAMYNAYVKVIRKAFRNVRI